MATGGLEWRGRFQEEAADLRNRDLGSLDDKQLLAHLDAFEGRVAGETSE